MQGAGGSLGAEKERDENGQRSLGKLGKDRERRITGLWSL